MRLVDDALLDKAAERRQFDKEILDSGLEDIMEKVVEEQVVKRIQTAYHNELIAPFMKEVKGLVELNLRNSKKEWG